MSEREALFRARAIDLAKAVHEGRMGTAHPKCENALHSLANYVQQYERTLSELEKPPRIVGGIDVRAGARDPDSGRPCAWANGGQDCKVPGCGFSSERCLLVRRNLGEV